MGGGGRGGHNVVLVSDRVFHRCRDANDTSMIEMNERTPSTETSLANGQEVIVMVRDRIASAAMSLALRRELCKARILTDGEGFETG